MITILEAEDVAILNPLAIKAFVEANGFEHRPLIDKAVQDEKLANGCAYLPTSEWGRCLIDCEMYHFRFGLEGPYLEIPKTRRWWDYSKTFGIYGMAFERPSNYATFVLLIIARVSNAIGRPQVEVFDGIKAIQMQLFNELSDQWQTFK